MSGAGRFDGSLAGVILQKYLVTDSGTELSFVVAHEASSFRVVHSRHNKPIIVRIFENEGEIPFRADDVIKVVLGENVGLTEDMIPDGTTIAFFQLMMHPSEYVKHRCTKLNGKDEGVLTVDLFGERMAFFGGYPNTPPCTPPHTVAYTVPGAPKRASVDVPLRFLSDPTSPVQSPEAI